MSATTTATTTTPRARRAFAEAATTAAFALGADAAEAAAALALAAPAGAETDHLAAYLAGVADVVGWSTVLGACGERERSSGAAEGSTLASLMTLIGGCASDAAPSDWSSSDAAAAVVASLETHFATTRGDGDDEPPPLRRELFPALAILVRRALAEGGDATGNAAAALRAVTRTLRALRRRRRGWIGSDDEAFFFTEAVAPFAPPTDRPTTDDASPSLTSLATIATVSMPPLKAGDAAAAAFASACVARAAEGISRRGGALDGGALLLAAACFDRSSLGHDADASAHDSSMASSEGDAVASIEEETAAMRAPVVLEKGACPELLAAFRALSVREEKELAAAAAARRFGGEDETSTVAAAPRSRSSRDDDDDDLLERGVCALTTATVERCAADLDARDWGRVIGRMESWPRARVDAAEVDAEAAATLAAAADDADDAGADAADAVTRAMEGLELGSDASKAVKGWTTAAATARLLLRVDALPIEVAAPETADATGDVVAYSAKGPDAARVATALARAGWPRARSDVHAAFARLALAVGAQARSIFSHRSPYDPVGVVNADP